MSTLATFSLRTLISWWTFTQARRTTPYLRANRLDEVERKEGEGFFEVVSLRFLARLDASLSESLMVMGILFPESRPISVKRVLTEGEKRI